MNEAVRSDSLRIRGHRLKHIKLFTEGNQTPEVYARKTVKTLNHMRFFPGLRGYSRDTVGKTRADRERAEAGFRSFFEKLDQLQPTDPVEIVVYEKDLICQSCPIGNHCVKPGRERYERAYVTEFARLAKLRGFGDDITLNRDPNEQLMSVVTSAQTLRTIAAEFTILQCLKTELRAEKK